MAALSDAVQAIADAYVNVSRQVAVLDVVCEDMLASERYLKSKIAECKRLEAGAVGKSDGGGGGRGQHSAGNLRRIGATGQGKASGR